MEETNIEPINKNESIKLTKNAKGDWQYEIKIIGTLDDGNKNFSISKIDLEHLDILTKHMEDKYGRKE
jgi:hypothetical protein